MKFFNQMGGDNRNMTFNIDIPAVKYGQKIDPKYTCRGGRT